MKIQHCLLLLLFSQSVFATTIQTEVAAIDISQTAQEPHLIFLTHNGIVGRLQPAQTSFFNTLQLGSKTHQLFQITLNPKNNITAIKKINARPPLRSVPDGDHFSTPYEPTILSDIVTAQRIFDGMRPNYRDRAQCYNKAHVWVYEENKKWKLNSMKVFMFFTTKYIREYNYNWWFHVSPFVFVHDGLGNQEKVLDYSYTNGPLNMKIWSDIFIHSHQECLVVNKYSDYNNHQNERHCFFMKMPMYYWQPWQIKDLEESGKEKHSFIQSEVQSAYRQAF